MSHSGPFRPGRMWRLAAAAAIVWSIPAAGLAQFSVTSELQSAFYPRQGIPRPAADGDLRGSSTLEYRRPLGKNVDFRGDFGIYGSHHRRAVVDGEAAFLWRAKRVELAAGLLREEWGRLTNSPLDALGPSNTAFSLVGPEGRLSQPTVRATTFLGGLSLDVYALAAGRRQPIPESDGRFGFGVPSRDVAPRGAFGDQSLAVRLSASNVNIDWSAHVFAGRSRRPTFVPRFTAAAGLEAVDAVYTHGMQAGGELETTRADWRFLAEGFIRRDGTDVTGRRRNYGYMAGAAEYQRLGAFDGAYNLIPRIEVMADTRGDAADVPFASAIRGGMRIASTQLLPAQVDVAYSYDWVFRGHGVMASVEKALSEAPTMNVGFKVTAFSGSRTRSVLDIWKDDLELYSYVRIEVSR